MQATKTIAPIVSVEERKRVTEYRRLAKLFTDKPHLLADGSILFCTNADMDGVDYVMGTADGVRAGVARFADMGRMGTRRYLESLYRARG